jgi:hypothetical protein
MSQKPAFDATNLVFFSEAMLSESADQGNNLEEKKSFAADDLSLEAIGKLISAISSEKWIEFYEESRSKTKAGKTKNAKQDARSASNVAARRVDTKRRG